MIRYVIFLILLVITSTILFLNRGNTKLQETFLLVVTTLIVAIGGVYIFSDTPTTIERKISTIYFLSNQDDKPLFFTEPILTHYYLSQGVLYGQYAKEYTKNNRGTALKIVDNGVFFCNLHSATLLQRLMESRPYNWFVRRVKENFPGSARIGAEPIGEVKNDVVIYKKGALEGSFIKNPFYKYVYGIEQFALPKGTKVVYEPYTDDHKYCQIEFIKPLYFDVKIKVLFSSYLVGLGNITYLVNISNDPYDRNYGTVEIDTICTAQFDKLLLGNPNIIKYKEWATNLFDDFYNSFSWQVCYDDIKDYMEFTADQTIINNDKKTK